MPRYYVNKNAQSTGEHEVHQTTGCPTPANPENRVALGEFATCKGAIAAARKHYANVDGCRNCSPACHTR